MSRLDRYWKIATNRRVLALFGLLAVIPLLLTINSFRPFVPFPVGVYSVFERAFRMLVYYPVTSFRILVFEPLGLAFLYTIPGIQQTIIVASLLAFYYAVSVVIMAVFRIMRRGLSGTQSS